MHIITYLLFIVIINCAKYPYKKLQPILDDIADPKTGRMREVATITVWRPGEWVRYFDHPINCVFSDSGCDSDSTPIVQILGDFKTLSLDDANSCSIGITPDNDPNINSNENAIVPDFSHINEGRKFRKHSSKSKLRKFRSKDKFSKPTEKFHLTYNPQDFTSQSMDDSNSCPIDITPDNFDETNQCQKEKYKLTYFNSTDDTLHRNEDTNEKNVSVKLSHSTRNAKENLLQSSHSKLPNSSRPSSRTGTTLNSKSFVANEDQKISYKTIITIGAKRDKNIKENVKRLDSASIKSNSDHIFDTKPSSV